MHSYSTWMGITHQLTKHAERVQWHHFQLHLRIVLLDVQYMQWGGGKSCYTCNMHVTCTEQEKTCTMQHAFWYVFYVYSTCNMHWLGAFCMHVTCMLHACYIYVTWLWHTCPFTFKLHACDMQDLMNMHAVSSNMHVTGATFHIGDPTATVCI